MPTSLITGGHGGIGFECAKQLATIYRHDLILAGRSTERLAPAAEYLRANCGVRVSTVILDISSLASVRAAATMCRELLDANEIAPLQSIICNAGGRFGDSPAYSVDGYEETFATNCLGHFLLVQLMIDQLDDHGRIVFTASGTHDPETMDGKMVGIAAQPDAIALASDGKNGGKALSGGVRYSTSKLCTILYAYELNRRLSKSGSSIASIAYDPGSVSGTGFLRLMPKPVQLLSSTSLLKWIFKRIGITMGSLGFSGDALAKIAADREFENGSGRYFQSNAGSLIETSSSKMSYDEQRARKLWTDSKTLAHLQPNEESIHLR